MKHAILKKSSCKTSRKRSSFFAPKANISVVLFTSFKGYIFPSISGLRLFFIFLTSVIIEIKENKSCSEILLSFSFSEL